MKLAILYFILGVILAFVTFNITFIETGCFHCSSSKLFNPVSIVIALFGLVFLLLCIRRLFRSFNTAQVNEYGSKDLLSEGDIDGL